MTRPRLDDRDPLEPREWRPTSHEWARRQAIEAAAEAVRRVKDSRKKPVEKETAPMSEQPYGPGAMCDDCGHFAGRHGEDGCPGVNNGCDCPGMLWLGVRWPRPWLPAPEGLVTAEATR